jgi:hypothetical protein
MGNYRKIGIMYEGNFRYYIAYRNAYLDDSANRGDRENYSWICSMLTQHFCYTTVALRALFKAKSLKSAILTHLNYCSGSELILGT